MNNISLQTYIFDLQNKNCLNQQHLVRLAGRPAGGVRLEHAGDPRRHQPGSRWQVLGGDRGPAPTHSADAEGLAHCPVAVCLAPP